MAASKILKATRGRKRKRGRGIGSTQEKTAAVDIGFVKKDAQGRVQKDKNGNPKPDPKRRDSEHIQLDENIDNYFIKKVKPNLPDSWMDISKNKVGYEINFIKYFYQYKPLRSLDEISQDLLRLDKETEGLMKEILV